MPKREPLLYDLFMAGPHKGPLIVPEFPHGSVRDAARFAFDSDASAFIGTLLTRAAPLILGEHEFARPPHHTTWIEFDFDAFSKALPPGSFEKMDQGFEDKLLAFLTVGNRIFVITNTVATKPAIMPYWYERHAPIGMDEEVRRAEEVNMSRLSYRQMLFGSQLKLDWFGTPEARDIANMFSLRFSGEARRMLSERPDLWRGLMSSQVGTLKYYIAMLLLLTRPGGGAVSIGEVPHVRSLVKGKSVVLAKHNHVTLHVAKDRALTRVIDHLHATGIHHRYHSVRGHWAQTRRNAIACTHAWEPATPTRYVCLHCEAKRWWKKDHFRGDASLGTVTKDFGVTV